MPLVSQKRILSDEEMARLEEANPPGGKVIRVKDDMTPQAPEMDIQRMAKESPIGRAGAELAASIAAPAVTFGSGALSGGMPGRSGDVFVPQGADRSSPVFKAGRVYGTLESPIYRGLSNLLLRGANKVLPYAMEAVDNSDKLQKAATWANTARGLGRNSLMGAGYGAAEESGNVAADVAEGKKPSLAAVPAASLYGGIFGAPLGYGVERGAEFLQKERVPQKIAELGMRGGTLAGAKRSNPSQPPTKSMLDLGISGSPVAIGDAASKMRNEIGNALKENIYPDLFNKADEAGYTVRRKELLEPIRQRISELSMSGQKSAKETIRALEKYVDRIKKASSGKDLSPRELFDIAESEKANLQSRARDQGAALFAERQKGVPTPTDQDAGRMIVSHVSDILKKSADDLGGPSYGRTFRAALEKYGKSKDVQRFAQDIEAERGAKTTGDMLGRASRMLFRPGITSGVGEFLNRATLPPSESKVLFAPQLNPLNSVSSSQDSIRMLNTAMQNGTISPEAAGKMVLEILNKGSGQ